MKKEITYIAFYSDPNGNSKRKSAPSADTKMDYIIHAMKKIGYTVKVISMCTVDDRNVWFKKHEGYVTKKDGVEILFYPCISSQFRIVRILGRTVSQFYIYKDMKKRVVHSNDIVIMYHSLGLYKIINYLSKYRKRIILEIEEIYSDVLTKRRERILKKELSMFSRADAYILSTALLREKLDFKDKKNIVCNGTYMVESDRQCKTDTANLQKNEEREIHCVYAGTFEPRKGVMAAANAAKFLPANYHIHILGFGNDTEVDNVRNLVDKLTKECECKISYGGCLTGEDYIRFIQSCDVGLSTQNPDAAFNATSFPSKILSYLANGLRVVSIRIPAIEHSVVGDKLFYYDNQTAEEIAEAIMRVDVNEEFNSRQMIKQLAVEFETELAKMLESFDNGQR